MAPPTIDAPAPAPPKMNLDLSLDEMIKKRREVAKQERKKKAVESRKRIQEAKDEKDKKVPIRKTLQKTRRNKRKKKPFKKNAAPGDKDSAEEGENNPQSRSPPQDPPARNVSPTNADRDEYASVARRVGTRHENKGVTVLVSNLHDIVTSRDLYELFSDVGPVENVRLKPMSEGSSTKEGIVTYECMKDALAAIHKYNDVPLDNQPLRISLATAAGAERTDEYSAGRAENRMGSVWRDREGASERRGRRIFTRENPRGRNLGVRRDEWRGKPRGPRPERRGPGRYRF